MYIKLLIPLAALVLAIVSIFNLDLIGAALHIIAGFAIVVILIAFAIASAYLIIKRKW
jgi:hypothetical protein